MDRVTFESVLGFPLDPFQREAIDALDAGRSVLVAAPTGAGKTVVAEYAVAKALAEGGKAFYTTPLKALSNQKYGDLVRRHGAESVGLLTGDTVVNGDARIVVMTTEVLRNMIYATSPALEGLRYVVLDEVHYLQDTYRGPVWEEVIIHTPPEVDLVCLSATVSNAEELTEWIRTVRGETATVIEERRPTELRHLFMVGERSAERPHLLPTLVDGRPNPVALELDAKAEGAAPPPHRGARRRGRLWTPRRTEVVEHLDDDDLLPAIYFIFSRAGCDDAVRQCLREHLRLTSPEERRRIRAIVESKVERLSDDDLRLLDYGSFLTGLEAGFAAHHAGMVPPFKEAVEACFAEALVKVVFATETLALGINMPARSVVIERLSKPTGDGITRLSPGEYTQLTGRAGRRGIDPVGHAVVLWSPYVPFADVAALVGSRTYRLQSSFRPTYNMAVNLVRRYRPDTAHHLLNLSFAQFQADVGVVREEARLADARRKAAERRADAACEHGDVAEYRRLHEDAGDAARARPAHRRDVKDALGRIVPGDVVVVPGGPPGDRVLVIGVDQRGGGSRLVGATLGSKRVTLDADDFPAPPVAVAHVELPSPHRPTSPAFLEEAAGLLRQVRIDPTVLASEGAGPGRRRAREAMARSAQAAAHPVLACPDIERHLRALAEAESLEREASRLERRIMGATGSLARQFDRVLQVLEGWGYVDGWSVTDAGDRLSRVFHECDLLLVEVLRSGLCDDLDAPSLAALLSGLSYEARRSAPAGDVRFPNAMLQERWVRIESLADELNLAEDELGLPLTRRPDPGFAPMAFGWAKGRPLDQVLLDEGFSGGDFVRITKQLIDLLRQVEKVADPAVADVAARARSALFRDVVAASSVVDAGGRGPTAGPARATA